MAGAGPELGRAVADIRSNASTSCALGINKDQVPGRVDEVIGSVKESTENAVGNVSLET
jgi:hypothetical protein